MWTTGWGSAWDVHVAALGLKRIDVAHYNLELQVQVHEGA